MAVPVRPCRIACGAAPCISQSPAGLAATVGYAATADARLVKFEVTSKESPTFGGYSWPGVGQYEKLVGMAYGELNPNDPKNAVIVDIKLAPRNARGMVEYSHTFYILKPIDLSKGEHKRDVRAAQSRRQDDQRIQPRRRRRRPGLGDRPHRACQRRS